MASRDKEGSHLSGVLGCFGLGSSSPGPTIIKSMKEAAEENLTDDLVLLMERRRGLPLGRAVLVNPVPST